MTEYSFNSFLNDLEQSLAPEILCLVVQTVISISIVINILGNWHRFPIKQLGPTCTLSALFSFIVINILSFIARFIEQQEGYYQFALPAGTTACGQCRLFGHPGMVGLALCYSALR
jgi:hypothetical protein